MNATILRFGHPETLIAEYEYWVVLLRQAQPTLGSLVLAAKGEVTAFSDLAPEAMAGLGEAVKAIERTLPEVVDHSKINYLMLMMVDPHVHFHVLPRYEGERSACGVTVADAGWPKVPALGQAVELTPDQTEKLVAYFKVAWRRP
jgi:diadenosine tetraphosphate (Ap4A) HIT family hydrolase